MVLNVTKVLKCQLLTKPTVCCLRKLHSEHIKVAWEKPQFGWTKLNFDGSSKGKLGKASIGGVIRDHNADFLLGYAESIGRTSSTIAEFAALRRGLELASENGWNHIWLEGDSKTLVDMIKRNEYGKCKVVQKHLDCINLFIKEFDKYDLTHIYREGNKVADKFAKIGQRLVEPQVWINPPKEVLPLVRDDANGKVVIRKK